MFYSTSYGKIYYEIQGSGPSLLLIHGTPFSSQVWSGIRDTIAQYFTVYTYDLLGYGQSQKATEVSLGVQNHVLAEMIAFWDIGGCQVVAHDFGGATLLRSIVLNGLQFEKMMLIDVVALSPWGSPFVRHVREHEAAFAGVPDYIHRSIVQTYIRDAMLTQLDDEALEYLVKPWLGTDGKPAFYRQIAQMDEKYTSEVSGRYKDIEVPIRILWGQEDGWIPIETGRRLAGCFSTSEFIAVPSSNHLMQVDQPQAITENILDFFKS